MRLDSLGKPPILQAQQEPRAAKSQNLGVSRVAEVRPPESPSSGDLSTQRQKKIGQILDLIKVVRRENEEKDQGESKKEREKKWQIAVQAYKKADSGYSQPVKKGAQVDVKG